MNQKIALGKKGEDIASNYLLKNGYQIIARNFEKPWGEIDVIAKTFDQILVFVEVKTIKQPSSVSPEMQMTKSKLKKLKRAASLWAGHYQSFISEQKGWRIDLITISLEGENCSLKHYKNIE